MTFINMHQIYWVHRPPGGIPSAKFHFQAQSGLGLFGGPRVVQGIFFKFIIMFIG